MAQNRASRRSNRGRWWRKGCRIQQHIPSQFVRALDPLERMLDRREIGLRRVGEQVRHLWIKAAQVCIQDSLINAHVRKEQRNIGHLPLARMRELAYPVDRVVIVECQQVSATRPKRI